MANKDSIYKHLGEMKKAHTLKSNLKKAKATLADEVKKCEASDGLVTKFLI